MAATKKIDNQDEENTYGKIVILIVSDQSKRNQSKEVFLKHSGFIVKTAESIDIMEHILNIHKIDIAIMDYEFKNKRGIKSIKRAKSRSYNPKLKFIVTSTQDQITIKENAYQNHCDLYLLESTPLSSLIQEIKNLAKLEYRKSERIKCHIAFTVFKEQEVYETVATNISNGGVYLLDIDNKIKPTLGGELSLEFKIPNTEIIIKCIGTIAHCSDKGFGIKFKDISKQDQIELNLFLKK
jgi:DNA-binding NarL/FixJ family response regulator